VRKLLQSERATEIREVSEQLDRSSVVEPEELPKHQDREELRLRELLGRILVGVGRKASPSDGQSFASEFER